MPVFSKRSHLRWILAGLIVPFSVSALGNDVSISNISGDIESPRRHTRISQAVEIEQGQAQNIYNAIRSALANGYTISNFPELENYQALRKFNTKPYLSSSHGNHYLNNYGNDRAKDYGKFEESNELPEGAVLFKDSFSVATNQSVILGPLFIMKKMPKGFNELTNNWKYIQVQPTGIVLGETNGENSHRVEYCIGCHLARETYDHLFFIPEEARVLSE